MWLVDGGCHCRLLVWFMSSDTCLSPPSIPRPPNTHTLLVSRENGIPYAHKGVNFPLFTWQQALQPRIPTGPRLLARVPPGLHPLRGPALAS